MHIDASSSALKEVIVHHIGNVTKNEPLILSKESVQLTFTLTEYLTMYFLSSFRFPEYFAFASPDSDLENCIADFRAGRTDFVSCSRMIAERLYDVSAHPAIQSGELIVSHFQELIVEDEEYEALGICKSEDKEKYLKVQKKETSFDVLAEEGINIHRLDKGCIILFTDDGFKILIVDKVNPAFAKYWKDQFLHVKPMVDNYHQTQEVLKLTQDFLHQEGDHADRAEVLARSKNFFKSREDFDARHFEEEVLADPQMIKSFKEYAQKEELEFDPLSHFKISAAAVKRNARVFKSVIKLDRNFHIYIHGNHDLIEKGYDEARGKKFYKIYFEDES